MKRWPLLALAVLAGCDSNDERPSDPPALRALAGNWDGALAVDGADFIPSVRCQDGPLDRVTLAFSLDAGGRGEPPMGTAHLELGNARGMCFVYDDLVEAVTYDDARLVLRFVNFEVEGDIARNAQAPGLHTLTGSVRLGSRALGSLVVTQAPPFGRGD